MKINVEVFVKISDAQVQPIAIYGTEIWGPKNMCQRKRCIYSHEKVPGGRWGTPNDVVYDELDRFPIYLNLYNLLSVTDTLTRMKNSRLPSKAYKMLYQ